MSAAFTKGPWTAGRCGIGGKVTIYCDRINHTIGDVVIYTEDEDECSANARLIAAAPDLYEALEESTRHLQEWLLWAKENGAISRAEIGAMNRRIDANEAALAKARGEQ